MKVDPDIGVRIDVEKQACHQLSHVEIGGGNDFITMSAPWS